MTNNSTNPTVSNNSTTSAPPSTNNNSSSSNNNNNKNHASFLPESVTTDLQRLILSVRPSETPKLVSIVSKHLTDVVSVAFPKPNTPPSVASTPTNTSNLSSDGEGGNNNNNNSSTISPTLSPATTTTGPALGGYDTRARSAVDLLCAVATCESLDNGARDVAREVLKLIHTDNIARLRGSNLAVARFTRVLLECYTDDYEGVTSALDDYFMESSNAVNVWLSMVAKHPQFGELILQLWGIGLGASSAVAASPSMFAIPWVKQQAHTKLISMLGDAIKEEDELPLFTFVQEIFQRGLNAHVGHFVDHILLGNCGESFIDAVIKAAEDVADGTLTHASAPCLPEALALLSSMLSMLQRSSVSQTSFQGDYYRTLRTNTTVQAFIDRLPRLSALLNSDALAARPGAFGSSRLRIVDACMTLFRFSRHDSDRALFDVKFITQLFSLCESFPNHDVVLGALAEICTEAIVRTIDDGKLEQYLVDECHLQDRLVQWVRDEKWANTSLRALALTVSFGLVQKAIKRVSDDDEDDENEDEEEEDDEEDQKMNVSDVDDDSASASSKKKKNNNNNKKKSKSHDDDGDDEIQSIDEIEIEGEAEDFDEPVVEEDDGDDFTEQRQTESHEIDDDDNGKVTRWTISTTTLFRTYSKSGKVIKKRLSTTKRKTYPSAHSSKSDSSSSSSSSDDEEDQHDHDDVLDSPALREAMKSDKKKNKKKNKKNNNNKNNDREDDEDGENDENDNKNNTNGETLTVATLSSEAVDKMSTFSNASKAWKNFVADDMREIWRDWFHEITGFRFQEPKSAGGKQVLHRPVVNLTRGSQQYQNRYGLNNNNNSNKTSEIGGDSENEKENGEEDGNQQALSFRSEAQSRKRAAAAAARRNARLGNMASYNLDTVIDVENGNKVISSRSSAYAASSKDKNSENGNNNDDDEEIVVTSPTDQEMMKFEDLRRKHDEEDDQEEDGSKTPPSSPSATGKGKIILKDNEFDMNIGDEDDEEDDELTDLSTTTGEENNGNGETSSKSNNNNNHNSGPPQRHRRTHSGHQESESIFDDVNNPTSSTADQQHSDPMSSFMNSRRPKTAPMPRGKNSVQNQNISRILREQEEQEEEERRQQQQQQQSQQHVDVNLDLDVEDEDVNHQMAHSEEEDSHHHQQQQDDEWVEKFITEVENENQNTNNNEPTSQHQGDDDEELEIDLNVDDDDEVAEMNHEPDGEEKQNVSRASTATTESSSSEPVVVTSSGTLQRKDDDDDDW